MRKKQALFPVTNDAVNQAVYRAVGGDVHRALPLAEYRVGSASVGWALFLIVYGALYQAVHQAEDLAVDDDPPHPGLKFYLAEVAR